MDPPAAKGSDQQKDKGSGQHKDKGSDQVQPHNKAKATSSESKSTEAKSSDDVRDIGANIEKDVVVNREVGANRSVEVLRVVEVAAGVKVEGVKQGVKEVVKEVGVKVDVDVTKKSLPQSQATTTTGGEPRSDQLDPGKEHGGADSHPPKRPSIMVPVPVPVQVPTPLPASVSVQVSGPVSVPLPGHVPVSTPGPVQVPVSVPGPGPVPAHVPVPVPGSSPVLVSVEASQKSLGGGDDDPSSGRSGSSQGSSLGKEVSIRLAIHEQLMKGSESNLSNIRVVVDMVVI